VFSLGLPWNCEAVFDNKPASVSFMSQSIPSIVFVHAVTPGQHNALCDYLNREGLAKARYMTVPGHVERYKNQYSGLVKFQPDGQIVGPQSYYYSDKTERSARISRGVLSALQDLASREKIDLIVAHSLWGSPLFLYDELDVPVVNYMEFPSYRLHGWDPQYPPTLGQRLTDKNMEMIHFYQALRSVLNIVPTEYAKSLFPPELQSRIVVQFEGFELPPPDFDTPISRQGKPFTVAFSARDLSSAKGYDTYMKVAQAIAERNLDIQCIALGSDQVSTYGYENVFLKEKYPQETVGFHEHLTRIYPKANVQLLGRLPYDEFSNALANVDVFLYPLKHGVGNWGLIEILGRGKAIVASETCFIPEVIQHGQNGLLVKDPENVDSWIDAILSIKNNWELRQHIQKGAANAFQKFSMSHVAPSYMSIFRRAIDLYAQQGR